MKYVSIIRRIPLRHSEPERLVLNLLTDGGNKIRSVELTADDLVRIIAEAATLLRSEWQCLTK